MSGRERGRGGEGIKEEEEEEGKEEGKGNKKKVGSVVVSSEQPRRIISVCYSRHQKRMGKCASLAA